TTPSNNTVVFNDGAVGTVTAATATALTVSFSTKPTTAGSLTAVVTSNSVSSGSAVQVASVAPVVLANTGLLLAANASSVTIIGIGFDTTASNNTVVFNDGAAGTVTAATATSLTVSFSTAERLPTPVGFVEKLTVSEGAVAAVTVPAAPSLKTTVGLLGVVPKPVAMGVS